MLFYKCLFLIMGIGSQIRLLRLEQGLTLGDLSERSGVDPGTISALENRDSNRSEYFSDLAQALGTTVEQLKAGNSTHKSALHQFFADRGPIEPSNDFIAVSRVLFKLSAGVTGYQVEPLEGNGPPIFFRRDWVEQRGYRADKLLAVKITGASMEPGLYDGDLVVINTVDVQPMDGEPFAANYEGELVIKRLKRDSGEWWLTSDNADKRRYPDKHCDENSSLIGRVIYKQSERI